MFSQGWFFVGFTNFFIKGGEQMIGILSSEENIVEQRLDGYRKENYFIDKKLGNPQVPSGKKEKLEVRKKNLQKKTDQWLCRSVSIT